MVKMRTRRHQSPAESSWVDGAKLPCEAQTTPTPKRIEATNGNQSEPAENSPNPDQKKVNGKKQKKRRRSPRNKASPPKVDSALLGMMADAVWLEKSTYDEAECYYHARLATEQTRAPEALPPTKALAVKHKTVHGAPKNSAAGGCCHSNMVACHHVSKGVWVNKFNFEDAENQFVAQFSSPLAPRVLNLNLVPPDCAAPCWMVKMRTRRHQSPAESGWVDGAKLPCEAQTTPKRIDATNGNQSEPAENSPNPDQKKVNGKKQKKRRRSPRKKASPPKVDSALLGMMADAVWLEKSTYDEAECYYHARLATGQTRAPEALPPTKALAVKQKTVHGAPKNSAADGCCHSNMVACHHVSKGVWVNKFNFEDAENQFVAQFSSPLAPRVLNLNLVPPDRAAPRSWQKTPDEGYASATPTPASAPGPLTVNSIVLDPTVNGKPHWAGLQSLLSEVWLDRSLYDQAETRYYEHAAQAASRAEPATNNWSQNKRGKKDKCSKKSAGKQAPARRKELTSIPEETANALYYPAYYLHADSERVWLDKSAYDKAEENFYSAQSHKTSNAVKPCKSPSVAKNTKPVKTRPGGKKEMANSFLSTEKIWFDKYKYDDAEKQYYENLSQKSALNSHNQTQDDGASTILRDIARARENIQKSLAGLRTVLNSPKEGQAPPPPSHSGSCTSTAAAPTNNGENGELLSRVASLEHENQNLQKVVKDLQSAISKLESRISTLEKSATSAPQPPAVCKLPAPTPALSRPPAAAPQPKAEEDDDDDDIDLFGSDEEEDAEAARIREERLAQYAEKKSKKPGLIAKSSILLDVKPVCGVTGVDDETDMAKLEECVRTVQMDGLLWGSSKLVPVGYGIKKLQIQCVVEDDKVGTDMLEEEITKFEDYVQSVDIAAFNKI